MAVILTPHKIEGIFSQLKNVIKFSELTDQNLLKLIGTPEVPLAAIEYIWQLPQLPHSKNKSLKITYRNYTSCCLFTDNSRKETSCSAQVMFT